MKVKGSMIKEEERDSSLFRLDEMISSSQFRISQVKDTDR